MSLLIFARGVSALSQIIIDVDKDWNAEEISNLASIIAGMMQGDIIYYDGSSLARLRTGSSGQNLQCLGPGANPKWS